MIALRTLKEVDVAVIQNWPPYPPEFGELDYALRGNGWIAEFLGKPDARIYIAEQAGEIVAFTTLAGTGDAAAEFRIALRADKIGRGLGKTITTMTLDFGFAELGLVRIHLIVRMNNPRAIRLYKRLGFDESGQYLQTVNGKPVNFLTMEITREHYYNHQGGERGA